jgi:hypothetical protein
MPMPDAMDQTGGGMMPMGGMPAQGQAPAAMQPGAMPMGNMPMMQGQSGAVQPGGMPCMQRYPGMMPMGGQPRGMGMRMNPAMMQAHMQRMEQHMANIETLLRQLVELQQQ